MNVSGSQVVRCPCCDRILFVVSPDGTMMNLKCPRGTNTQVAAVARLGIVRQGAAAPSD